MVSWREKYGNCIEIKIEFDWVVLCIATIDKHYDEFGMDCSQSTALKRPFLNNIVELFI